MSKIQKFEDLIAWQKAREFVKEIYKMTRQSEFAKDFGLSDQIRRATVSIMSNIAEGFERSSRLEFNRFLFMVKASCAEVRSHLYVAYDCAYLTNNSFEVLLAKAEEIGRIIGGLRLAVIRNKN